MPEEEKAPSYMEELKEKPGDKVPWTRKVLMGVSAPVTSTIKLLQKTTLGGNGFAAIIVIMIADVILGRDIPWPFYLLEIFCALLHLVELDMKMKQETSLIIKPK